MIGIKDLDVFSNPAKVPKNDWFSSLQTPAVKGETLYSVDSSGVSRSESAAGALGPQAPLTLSTE